MNDINKELVFTSEQTALQLVPITNCDDKRQITAVLAATMTGEYLPAQLIFKGKTHCCHPSIIAPPEWNFWHSESHWSTKETMTRGELKLDEHSQALAIFDCFKGQTTKAIYDLLESKNIRVVKVRANCTDIRCS
uniref:DDE-1 domain-containing protein n=1 Tax=Amphimedon queenslandica TaxID=400682 RepID=A0A1X7V073_AMPQE